MESLGGPNKLKTKEALAMHASFSKLPQQGVATHREEVRAENSFRVSHKHVLAVVIPRGHTPQGGVVVKKGGHRLEIVEEVYCEFHVVLQTQSSNSAHAVRKRDNIRVRVTCF